MENRVVVNNISEIDKRIKKSKAKKNSKDESIEDLIHETKDAILQLQTLRKYYQFVVDEELIEYAIYREKAEKERISYLIKKIKEMKNTRK